jgi:hypothetical protein
MLYCAIENPDNDETVPHHLLIVGTGWEIELEELQFPKFISTVKSGPFVWHVFEIEDMPF